MAQRKFISTRTRFEIFKRDGFRCVHCGATPQGAPLHVDHIKPVSEGGTNEDMNLVTSCESCNLGKSNVPLDQHRFKVGDPARAKEHAEQLRAYLKAQQEVVGAMDGARQQLVDRWCETLGCDTFHKNLPGALTKAVEEFGITAVVDIIDSVATSRHRWATKSKSYETDIKYFYGCLRRRRESAAPKAPVAQVPAPSTPTPTFSEKDVSAARNAAEWKIAETIIERYVAYREDGSGTLEGEPRVNFNALLVQMNNAKLGFDALFQAIDSANPYSGQFEKSISVALIGFERDGVPEHDLFVSSLAESNDQQRTCEQEVALSMFGAAWERLTKTLDDEPGECVKAWFREAYSEGIGGGFALRFLFDCAERLVGKGDQEQRRILIETALSSEAFVDNVYDLACRWAASIGRSL